MPNDETAVRIGVAPKDERAVRTGVMPSAETASRTGVRPDDSTGVRTYDAVKALAFIGDLSMGQPTDHSMRTGWLAYQLALAADLGPAGCDAVREAALLRWSGCTANAPGFAEKFGDDVASREAMLAQRPDWTRLASASGDVGATLMPLAQIHCEVSTEVARLLGLCARTQSTLRQVFESWDGHGIPEGRRGQDVEPAVFVVALAGDLEVLTRVYGVDQALDLISRQADKHYPAALAAVVYTHARQWLLQLESLAPNDMDAALCTTQLGSTTAAPALIADIIDLKLPWMTGYSREVARTAAQCHGRLSTDLHAAGLVYQAGLIHGIGRAAVPNTIWNTPGKLSPSAWEKIRLVPYWTSRAGRQGGSLAAAAELASHAYERCDGSGYFRGAGSTALSLEAQVLAAAAAWVALRSPRPWRGAYALSDAQNILRGQAEQGLFRNDVIDALLSSDHRPAEPSPPTATVTVTSTAPAQELTGVSSPPPPAASSSVPTTASSSASATEFSSAPSTASSSASASSSLLPARLSPREIEVLRLISRGASNKEAAKALALSPSTVGTHIESLFRKLECSTRAAATLKASAAGLL